MSEELRKIVDELVGVEVDLGNMAMATRLALNERERDGASEDEMDTISVYSKGYVDAIQFAFDKIKGILDPYLEAGLEEEKEVKEQS